MRRIKESIFENQRKSTILSLRSVELSDLIENKNLVPQKPGIYIMYNKQNYKPYVGESVNVSRRLIEHAIVQYPKQYIDREIRKNGVKNFRVAFLQEERDLKRRRIVEGKYVDLFNAYYNGYNGSIDGNPTTKMYRFFDKIKKKLYKKIFPKLYTKQRQRNKYRNIGAMRKFEKYLLKINR
jgi:GIY-YIG catalytic domain protein